MYPVPDGVREDTIREAANDPEAARDHRPGTRNLLPHRCRRTGRRRDEAVPEEECERAPANRRTRRPAERAQVPEFSPDVVVVIGIIVSSICFGLHVEGSALTERFLHALLSSTTFYLLHTSILSLVSNITIDKHSITSIFLSTSSDTVSWYLVYA